MAENTVSAPPSVAALATTSPSSSREARGSGSQSLQLTRRRSNQERINDILETARSRAESMSAIYGPASPRLQPLLQSGNVSPGGILERDPASEDEHNGGLVMRAPSPRQPPNYRTLTPAAATPQSGSSSRVRKSARSSRRSSGNQRQGTDGAGETENLRREDHEDKEKWWLRIIKNFKTLELENKGSVARDHLALERTFLAWLRTSLAFASIGIAITQLFRLNTSLSDGSDTTLRAVGRPLGITFLGISIIMLFLGYRRYFDGQQYIMKGKFPASRSTIIFVSFLTFAVTVASLVVIIAVHSSS